MATSPIDLSSGLVPKAPVDLSAGLVPKDQPDSRSLLQKAQDAFDKITTVTPEQRAGHGAIVNAAQDFGAGAIQGFGAPIVHPMDTLSNLGHMIAHPIDSAHQEVDALRSNPANFAGNAAGGALLGEAAAPAVAPIAESINKGAARALLLGKTPADAYESALKPSTTLTPSERAQAVQTGLQNEIPISKSGVEKIADRIDTLNQAIKGEIAKDPTRPINPNAVATRTANSMGKFSNQVNASGDLQAIQDSKNQFLAEQGATPSSPAPDMTADKAQAMKQGTYRVLAGKFGEQGSAAVEAQKDLARGLKEEIANQFPEISNLNATESKLLDLQPILERAVGRIGNHQLVGIGTPVTTAAAHAATGSAPLAVVAGVMKAVLDNPNVKSRLAIAISKSSKIPIGQAMQKVAAYSSTLGASVASQNTSSTSDNPDQSNPSPSGQQ